MKMFETGPSPEKQIADEKAKSARLTRRLKQAETKIKYLTAIIIDMEKEMKLLKMRDKP